MDRTTARAAAMKLIYEWEMGGEGGLITQEGLLDITPDDENGEEFDYMNRLVEGVKSCAPELDELIGKFADGWSVDRISRVDLSIMRVAVYELTRMGQPAGVAVNEALELARAYSTPQAVSFINGVLGSLVRSL